MLELGRAEELLLPFQILKDGLVLVLYEEPVEGGAAAHMAWTTPVPSSNVT